MTFWLSFSFISIYTFPSGMQGGTFHICFSDRWISQFPCLGWVCTDTTISSCFLLLLLLCFFFPLSERIGELLQNEPFNWTHKHPPALTLGGCAVFALIHLCSPTVPHRTCRTKLWCGLSWVEWACGHGTDKVTRLWPEHPLDTPQTPCSNQVNCVA